MRSIGKRYGGGNEYNETSSRNLVLSSSITDTAVREIIESILDINSADDELSAELTDYRREPIKLVINSFGGSVYDGFALIAAIEQSKTPIHGYAYGSAMSMAFAIYISTHVRFAHKTTTFMYHEISDYFYDNITGAKQNIKECERIQKVYDNYVTSRTSLPVDKIKLMKDKKEDWYISAQEALRYKIVHKLV
jgi:ATP-dependent Clp protease protease subunit